MVQKFFQIFCQGLIGDDHYLVLDVERVNITVLVAFFGVKEFTWINISLGDFCKVLAVQFDVFKEILGNVFAIPDFISFIPESFLLLFRSFRVADVRFALLLNELFCLQVVNPLCDKPMVFCNDWSFDFFKSVRLVFFEQSHFLKFK